MSEGGYVFSEVVEDVFRARFNLLRLLARCEDDLTRMARGTYREDYPKSIGEARELRARVIIGIRELDDALMKSRQRPLDLPLRAEPSEKVEE